MASATMTKIPSTSMIFRIRRDETGFASNTSDTDGLSSRSDGCSTRVASARYVSSMGVACISSDKDGIGSGCDIRDTGAGLKLPPVSRDVLVVPGSRNRGISPCPNGSSSSCGCTPPPLLPGATANAPGIAYGSQLQYECSFLLFVDLWFLVVVVEDDKGSCW